MVANFGLGSLVIAFIISLYGTVAAIYGVRKSFPQWIESARLAMLLTFPLISITSLSIIFLLLQGDYNVEFVASVVSNSMPAYLKVTALWGGQAGSLIFWSWLLSAFATTVTLQKWDRDVEFLPG
jgi:cytochrome c-type biogenesis protein CcmF